MNSKSWTSPRDPDVTALMAAEKGILDPRSLVTNQARALNALYRKFDSSTSKPFDRLVQLASLKGFAVAPMQLDGRHDSQRDAVVLMADSASKGGQIFYNPLRSPGRIAFSIAHEIAHTFFPSTQGGARFREMLDDEWGEANELERLCNLGAAELLMPLEEFSNEAAPDWSIRKAEELANTFGASLEATIFRLATAHPEIAIAGTAYFRHTKGDQARLDAFAQSTQAHLFSPAKDNGPTVEPPKYRRQSLHCSDKCSKRLMIPWNKSFNPGSCIYQASTDQIAFGAESHPTVQNANGKLCSPSSR